MITLADMHKQIKRELIEYLLDDEAEIIVLRNEETKNVFNKKLYKDTWQYTLNRLRERIKKEKNEFRSYFQEDFIPSK